MSHRSKSPRARGTLLLGLYESIFLSALLLAIALASGASPAYGQAYSASLTGAVTDPKGGVMPGVPVQLQNQATHDTRVVKTGADGHYMFSELAPGTYTLAVTAPGFKTFVQSGITLEPQIASAIDVTMQIGSSTTTLEVTSAAPLLDTQSANQQATLNQTQIAELPTGIQSPLPLVLAFAGTTTVGMQGAGNLADQTVDENFSRFGLDGGRDMGNLVLLDGVPDTAADWGGLLVSPSSEATQEMQVIRDTYDSQFGKTGGGVVSIVTKTGTDRFHGEAYGFLRNSALDATPWSGNTYTTCSAGESAHECDVSKKPEFKREEFGGIIGGPISRAKHVYFMADYDGLRVPAVSFYGPTTVPTAQQRQGDFSQSYNQDGTLQVLYNPFTTTYDSTTNTLVRQPFAAACVGVVYPQSCAGNVIPSSLMDPVGTKVMALFPASNIAGEAITNANNYFGSGSSEIVNDHIDARIDWAHNDKHSMYGRWSQRIREDTPTPDFFGNGATPVTETQEPGFNFVLGNTITPSPTLVINVLLGTGYWNQGILSPAQGKLTPASIGLNPADFQAQLMPPFAFDNYTGLGGGGVTKYIRYEDTVQVDVTKQKGPHSIKFGFYFESAEVNDINRDTGPPSYSPYDFSTCQTAAQPNITCFDTGNGVASLLLGVGNGGGPSTFNPDLAIRMPYYGFYGQDTWRATHKLTLTFGMRYEIQSGATERHNRWSLLDLNATNPLAQLTGLPLKGAFVYANSNNRGLWPTDFHDFAPRIGFAYNVTPKLVARGGFGIFFLPAQALIGLDNPGQDIGYSAATSWLYANPSDPFQPYNLISNPYPNGITQPTGASTSFTATEGQGIGQVWLTGSHPDPYKLDYSFDLQYEFGPSTVLEAGFSGFGGRKLPFGNPALNPDQLPDSTLGLGFNVYNPVANPFAAAVAQYPALANTVLAGSPCPSNINAPSCISQSQLLIPYPEYYYFTLTRSYEGATANFDSLWMKFTHKFSGGLTLLSTYQWSKSLDDASEDQGWELGGASSPWRDYYNRKLEYSVSAADVPQSFVTSLVYQLPVGRGKHFGSSMSKPLGAVVGGWTTSGILHLSSGYPVNIEAPYSYAGSTGYPNLVNTHLLNSVNRNPGPGGQWFNTCTQLLSSSGTYYAANCASGEQTAWVQAQNFTYGNAPRYISNLRSDWTRDLDFSLSKTFKPTERVRVQIRTDIFNLFNTPIFGGPDSFLTDQTFGQVFGVNNSPREIQLGMKVSF